MNFKTDSNFKESTRGKIRKHEEQIARVIGSLNSYKRKCEIWQQMLKIPGNTINGLLQTGKYATGRVEQFTKKRLLYREVNFYDPIQRITIATLLKKKKQRKVISVLKEDHQAVDLFVIKYPEKHDAFNYPLITVPLSVSTPEGESYQPKAKYFFKNYLIDLSKHQSQ